MQSRRWHGCREDHPKTDNSHRHPKGDSRPENPRQPNSIGSAPITTEKQIQFEDFKHYYLLLFLCRLKTVLLWFVIDQSVTVPYYY